MDNSRSRVGVRQSGLYTGLPASTIELSLSYPNGTGLSSASLFEIYTVSLFPILIFSPAGSQV